MRSVIRGRDVFCVTVRQPTDLLDEMNVKQFMALVRRAGLEHKLNNVSNVTIFAPTDKALDGRCQQMTGRVKREMAEKYVSDVY